MPSPENLLVVAIDTDESIALNKKSSSLIYGSTEMINSVERLALGRLARIGGAFAQLTLETTPVTEPLEA